ncbi:uncharacterized protein LOC117784448 [Drosophila innubila]|uniref:uncharacterized protein LOC117784448 n=1 Tax=Drosophila innubila TaxID=198719 RepID=UPI00148DD681|nr:uncharacterized protein LOC117784448 [Drosophila innubila]
MSDQCNMFKKAKNHKKMHATRPEVVELYKNNTFVSDSLSSTCVSSVKFTADGQKSTKTIGKLSDRHLKANLKLPELEERCAISSNKNLYNLSKQLADYEAENQSDENSKEFQPKGDRLQNNLDRSRSMRSDNKDCNLNQTYNIVDNSSVSLNTEYKDYKMPKVRPVHSVKRKQKKIKKIMNKKNSTSSSDESCYNTARSSQPQARNEKHNDKQQDVQIANYLVELQPQEKPEKKTLSQSNRLKLNSSLLNLNVETRFKEFIQLIKLTLQTIDDWYTFTLLLFLGTAAYLIYILCYDINIYVNEERRYLAKMRSSGIVLKCFYYVMRLLKVPIF